jgi:hypothetical protein
LAVLNRPASWGKDKRKYYNADTADLEIGQVKPVSLDDEGRRLSSRALIAGLAPLQDFADAEEEEEAAREVEQVRKSFSLR